MLHAGLRRARSVPLADPLQYLFGWLQLDETTGARLECWGRWAMNFEASSHVRFGAILEGRCVLEAARGAVTLEQGDGYILAPGHRFRLYTCADAQPANGTRLFRSASGSAVRYGDEKGVPVILVGGRFPVNEMSTVTMLKMLPELIHLSAADDLNARALSSYLSILDHETAKPRMGASLIRHHVAQMMLVHAFRLISQREEKMKAERLRGMAHPRIGPVLELIHADPRANHPLVELAKVAGMSRAVFARSFKDIVGIPPAEYMLKVRMGLAEQLLASGQASLSKIALDIGYQSVRAFSESFRRVTGRVPRMARPGL